MYRILARNKYELIVYSYYLTDHANEICYKYLFLKLHNTVSVSSSKMSNQTEDPMVEPSCPIPFIDIPPSVPSELPSPTALALNHSEIDNAITTPNDISPIETS